MTGYVYVASPYTHVDKSIMHLRYLLVMDYTAKLLAKKVWAFSPIVHCFEMARRHSLPHDHEFWLEFDQQMMDAAAGMHVLKLPGWEESRGVQWEIKYWNQNWPNLPIVYADVEGGSGIKVSRGLERG